ncbi:MAG: TetR/AcrR family transcriptional regulator [Candidatus Saccharibacteria bacterium]|nr:TetR/AcrR family transcriptional regulator [Candidatus Saccharibacteria bacterium]
MKEIKYNSSKRTHERIKQTFAELLSEKKTVNNITVAELAKRAEITRGTFYAHFNNIKEVSEEVEKEVVERLQVSNNKIENIEDFPVFLHEFFQFLAENEELYRQILSSEAPMAFVNRLNLQITQAARDALKANSFKHPIQELDITFYIDGATYMILKYFRGEISMSLNEIEWYLKERAFEMFLKDFSTETPEE